MHMERLRTPLKVVQILLSLVVAGVIVSAGIECFYLVTRFDGVLGVLPILVIVLAIVLVAVMVYSILFAE